MVLLVVMNTNPFDWLLVPSDAANTTDIVVMALVLIAVWSLLTAAKYEALLDKVREANDGRVPAHNYVVDM